MERGLRARTWRWAMLVGALVSILAAALIGGCAARRPAIGRDLMHINCLKKPDPGPCRGSSSGYYYDYQRDRCLPIHGGCDGQHQFDSLKACIESCGPSA